MPEGYGAVYLCGGDMTPGPRGTDCPSPLHDYPLPSGYNDAADEAASRLYRRWSNKRCPRCGLYGWAPPAFGLARSVPSETAQTEENETRGR